MFNNIDCGKVSFIGSSTKTTCHYCKKNLHLDVYGTYSDEDGFGLLKRFGDRGSLAHDGHILFVCPECDAWNAVMGLEAAETIRKKIAKKEGAKSAYKFMRQAREDLAAAEKRIHSDLTREIGKASIFSLQGVGRKSFKTMLKRLGLLNLLHNMEN